MQKKELISEINLFNKHFAKLKKTDIKNTISEKQDKLIYTLASRIISDRKNNSNHNIENIFYFTNQLNSEFIRSKKNNNKNNENNLIIMNDKYDVYYQTKINYFCKLNDKNILKENLDEILKGSEKVLTEINDIYDYNKLNESFLKDFTFNLKNILFLDIYCDFLYLYLFIRSKHSLHDLNINEFFHQYLILYNLRMYSINILQFTSNLFNNLSTKALDMYLLILKFCYNALSNNERLPLEALLVLIQHILMNLSDKFINLQDINSFQIIVNIYIHISLIFYILNKKEKSKNVFEKLIYYFEEKELFLLKYNIHPNLYKENMNFYVNCLINYYTISIKEKDYKNCYLIINKLVTFIDNYNDIYDSEFTFSVYYRCGKITFTLKYYNESEKVFIKILDLIDKYKDKHILLKGKVFYFLSKIMFIGKFFKKSLVYLNEFIKIYQSNYEYSNSIRLYNAYKLYLRIWMINNTYDTNLIFLIFLLNNSNFIVHSLNICLILKAIKVKIDNKESDKAEGIFFYLMSMLSNIQWHTSYCKKIFNFFQDLIESKINSNCLKEADYLTNILKELVEKNEYFSSIQKEELFYYKHKILENFGVLSLKKKIEDCIKHFTDRQLLIENHYEKGEKNNDFFIKIIINYNYLAISHLKFGNKEISIRYFKKYCNRHFLQNNYILLNTKYIKICENIINIYLKSLDVYRLKDLFIYISQELEYLPTNMYLEKTLMLRKISKYYYKKKSWNKCLDYNIKILDSLQKVLINYNWDKDLKSKLFENYLEIFYQVGVCSKKLNDNNNFYQFSKYFLQNFSSYKRLDFPLTDKIIYYYSEVNFNLGLRTYQNHELIETIEFISKALNNIFKLNKKPTKKVSDCFYILGMVYNKLNDRNNSKMNFKTCYELRKEILGAEHSLTLIAEKKLEEYNKN